jgi:hypothetical protein
MNQVKRHEMEIQVIRKLLQVAKAHGYTLSRIWDGECYERPHNDDDAVSVVFSVDECQMLFKHPDEDKAHCAVIILGNSPWEVIADSSMGGHWDAVMEAMNVYTDELEAQS